MILVKMCLRFPLYPALKDTMLSPSLWITLDIQTLTPISTIYKHSFIRKAFRVLSFMAGFFMITVFFIGGRQTQITVINM